MAQDTLETIAEKDFIIEEVWDHKEYPNSGTSRQLIRMRNDYSLIIWNQKPVNKEKLQPGVQLKIFDLTLKKNNKGYKEYHTGNTFSYKFINNNDKGIMTETAKALLEKEKPGKTAHQCPHCKNVIYIVIQKT